MRSGASMALALAVAALGAFVVFEAVTGPDNPGYARVGPGAFPGVVGAGLILVGLALLFRSLRGEWRVVWIEHGVEAHSAQSRESGNPDTTPSTHATLGPRFRGNARTIAPPLFNVGLVAAALILDVILMAPLGFIVASATLFTLAAAAFGSRRPLIDAALGLAFGSAIYLVFVRALGLHLPAGDVWGLLPWMS
jgi:putative tricarboxylic transport membrane protein